jgi:hypothetical protein
MSGLEVARIWPRRCSGRVRRSDTSARPGFPTAACVRMSAEPWEQDDQGRPEVVMGGESLMLPARLRASVLEPRQVCTALWPC